MYRKLGSAFHFSIHFSRDKHAKDIFFSKIKFIDDKIDRA